MNYDEWSESGTRSLGRTIVAIVNQDGSTETFDAHVEVEGK